MADYFKQLTEGVKTAPVIPTADKQPADQSDYYDKLIQTQQDALAAGQPEKIAPISDSDKGAGFWSLAESHIADDPGTRMRILAENRFPNLSPAEAVDRYRYLNGEIVYKGDDGKWYKSEPDGFWQGVKQFGAELVPSAPTMAGAGYGAAAGATAGSAAGGIGAIPGGIIGAIIGAAGGEGSRKVAANTIYDEPQTAMGNIKDMATEAAFAGTGELAGRGLLALKNMHVVDDFAKLDQGAADALIAKARDHNIPLTAAEASGLKSMLNRQMYLTARPGSDDVLGDFLQKRHKDIDNSINNYLNKLSTVETPEQAYEMGIRAAESRREQLVAKRANKANPLYQAAEQDPVNISNVQQVVEDLTETYSGTTAGKKFNAVLRSLDGKGTVGELQAAKEQLDDMIVKETAKVKEGKATATVQAKLMQIKNALLRELETQSPAYKVAREAYEKASKPITHFDDSLARSMLKEGDKAVAPNLNNVLFGTKSSPKAIRVARAKVLASDKTKGPAAWNAVVRGHLQEELQKITESATGEAVNLGGQFRKKVFGNQRTRNMLEAALTKEQYRGLNDLMHVLEATGKGMRGQSATQPFSVIEKQMGKEAVNPIRAGKLISPDVAKDAAKWAEDLSTGRYAQQMAEALVDQSKLSDLRQAVKILRKTKEGTEQWTQALSSAMGVLVGEGVDDE